MTAREKSSILALGLLVVAVHLVGFPRPLGPLHDILQPILQVAAIDVSLTPITADMAALVDRKGRALYDTPVLLVPIIKGEARAPISFERLSFHRVSVPMVTYLDHIVYGEDVPELRKALCRSLSDALGIAPNGLDSFAVIIPEHMEEGQEYGLNRRHSCRGSGEKSL